jgi:ornithine cyclodeaminase/alanine dehydrogenase-like protein (mu-crystallin family)
MIPFFSSEQIIRILTEFKIDKSKLIEDAYLNLYAPSNAPKKMRVSNGSHDILIMPFRAEKFLINKTMLIKNNQETPGVFGWLTLYDIEKQEPVATFDATALTGIRTAAKSLLVAKSILDHQKPKHIHIYGSSTQALHHYIQFSEYYSSCNFFFIVRKEKSKKRIRRLIQGGRENYKIIDDQHPILDEPDIIITTTKSKKPIIIKEKLRNVRLLVAVGSSDGQSTEIDLDIVSKCKIVVDSKISISGKGELNLAIKKNLITSEQITELHTLLTTGIDILKNGPPILFVSKGLAIEDYIFAKNIIKATQKNDLYLNCHD